MFCPRLDPRNHVAWAIHRRQKNDRNRLQVGNGLDALGNGESVELRQVDVEDEDRWTLFDTLDQSGLAVTRRDNDVTFVLEGPANHHGYGRVVFDDQNRRSGTTHGNLLYGTSERMLL